MKLKTLKQKQNKKKLLRHRQHYNVYHPYDQMCASSGHPSAVAQPSSWVGPWEDASYTDGLALDGSEESW